MEIIKKREEYMKKILQKIKNIDIKYLHIALIVLGSIFILLSAFHTNLWFDESYSVGLANHSFCEIWTIDKNDVHPVVKVHENMKVPYHILLYKNKCIQVSL